MGANGSGAVRPFERMTTWQERTDSAACATATESPPSPREATSPLMPTVPLLARAPNFLRPTRKRARALSTRGDPTRVPAVCENASAKARRGRKMSPARHRRRHAYRYPGSRAEPATRGTRTRTVQAACVCSSSSAQEDQQSSSRSPRAHCDARSHLSSSGNPQRRGCCVAAASSSARPISAAPCSSHPFSAGTPSSWWCERYANELAARVPRDIAEDANG